MEKRKPKNPIKFQITLNDEQKECKSLILENKVTVIKGQAGSGKSLVAVQAALDMLFTGMTEKIILSRPTVTAGEEVGILPGNADQKLEPYVAPLIDALYTLYSKEKIDSLVHEGKITVMPVGFMRGRNFSNCVVVVDEGQNITDRQMRLILGRLCTGSKLIICGDTSQVDLKNPKDSGFAFIYKNMTDVPGFKVVTLKTNHRDPIVEAILEVYNKFE